MGSPHFGALTHDDVRQILAAIRDRPCGKSCIMFMDVTEASPGGQRRYVFRPECKGYAICAGRLMRDLTTR